MGALKLDIPEEVVRSLRFPQGEEEQQLSEELALALYRRAALSLGKARQLARMTRRQFHELLGKRGITRHYAEEDLAEDVAYARGDR